MACKPSAHVAPTDAPSLAALAGERADDARLRSDRLARADELPEGAEDRLDDRVALGLRLAEGGDDRIAFGFLRQGARGGRGRAAVGGARR